MIRKPVYLPFRTSHIIFPGLMGRWAEAVVTVAVAFIVNVNMQRTMLLFVLTPAWAQGGVFLYG